MFSNTVAPQSQKEVTVSCQYCNSQFKSENPDYVSEIPVHPKAGPVPVSDDEKQYRKYKSWSSQGYVGGIFLGIIGMILINSYNKTGKGDKMLGAVILLIGAVILIWSGWAYGKKMKAYQKKL